MGEVWRGEDALLNRAVAVKLLPTGRAGDEAFLARFRAEARYAASLSHPGIARVYDYGESAEFGGAYLVMELVGGEPLSAILARAGRLSPDATLDIVSQAARALDAAHQAGIVHRDIKPGNLLVAAGGTTKITDFGIATAAAAAQAAHLTETGMVMGTALYVSPEQATGAPVDASSDIYSLGVVAYECLAGHVAVHGPRAAGHRVRAQARAGARAAARRAAAGQPIWSTTCWPRRPRSARRAPGRWPTARTCCGTPWPWATRPAAGHRGRAPGRGLRPGHQSGPASRARRACSAGRRRPGRPAPASAGGRQLVTAGLTAALCALAAAAGLYLSGHLHGQTSGNTGNNTVQQHQLAGRRLPSRQQQSSRHDQPNS